MMLWLFNHHHILPGAYYRLPEGEKLLLRAFYSIIKDARKGLL